MAHPNLRLGAELVERVHTAGDLSEWKHAVLVRLQEEVGCETAYWGHHIARENDLTVRAPDERVRASLARFGADPQRYIYPPVHPRILAAGGVAVDVDVLSANERDRLPLYAEVLRPVGICTYLACDVTFRGRSQSFITLSRHGRCAPFGVRERETMLAIKSILGIVEGAFEAEAAQRAVRGAPEEPRAALRLTPRESQVANLIARGLQNKEIAAHLGTSPETVRKQTIRIYEKAGVSGRVALAVLLADGDCERTTRAAASGRR